MTDKTRDEKVREVVWEFGNETIKLDRKREKMHINDWGEQRERILVKALSQLNALDKPEIDERKIVRILKNYQGGNELHIATEWSFKNLARAIAAEAKEWMR